MNILICDDSGMARKQMMRALPPQLSSNVQFAEHGQQALDILEASSIDLLLLDLTMPVMDGYETLAQIRDRAIECITIVVSGDIQPEAQQRVLSLGALAFHKKPVDGDQLEKLLTDYGLLQPAEAQVAEIEPPPPAVTEAVSQTISPKECLREVSNVAMGQAADKLARLLNAFINLPIPRVDILSAGELAMTLESLAGGQHLAVSQGFVGRGLAAEALLSTDLKGVAGLQKLMSEHNANTGDSGVGSILDAAAVLTGAFLTGIGEILDLDFSRSQSVILSAANVSNQEWRERVANTEDTLTIEIPYHFEEGDFVCDLLLLFPGKAGDYLLNRASYLSEGEF
ncbi:response regulator [Pseudomaricurvus alkylphenolicus]|jgi:CheY-like chemotaxis protein|uniref:response regulator n=1 Tax=Pseudomaricurvus alkylphenolicus TaxID=1306991 RepID=UPI00141FD661|nr:response regulator [Pseudomaricurvus alkylphenolicus]NIB39396.1 response regulator [Pseudomaricurvus alkylphenolicus]